MGHERPRWEVRIIHLRFIRKKTKAILFVGIDLAKPVFAQHGVDEHDKVVPLAPKVARDRLLGMMEAVGLVIALPRSVHARASA